MKRRDVLTIAPAALAALAVPAVAETLATEDGPLFDRPFLMPLASDPDLLAVCLPMTTIRHAYCYMLRDGRTIYAEGSRCDDGSGWRVYEPGEFDGRVIGRVVLMLVRRGSGWAMMGASTLDG